MGFRKRRGIIKTSVLFVIVLAVVGYAYIYFNAATEYTLIDFLKKDGLKTLFISIFAMFGVYLAVKIFKLKKR